jgi:hypothetical protein
MAYRAGKAVRGAPDSFGQYRASEQTRSPSEILAHIGDLMEWALAIAQGQQQWRDPILFHGTRRCGVSLRLLRHLKHI